MIKNMIKDASFGIIPFIINNNQIKYLVIHQQKGHWAFPKGHAEGKEAPIETAKRELFEETGLKIGQLFDQNPFIEKYIFTNPQNQQIDKTVTYFLAKVVDDKVAIQDEELSGYGWFTRDEALKIITFDQAKTLLKKVDDFLVKKE